MHHRAPPSHLTMAAGERQKIPQDWQMLLTVEVGNGVIKETLGRDLN